MADTMNLSEWGLPPLIISWFKKKGITKLFEWQVECLRKNDVLFGGNLVYSAPTSAGKTLVADFLLLKRVLEGGKKALVIEPFVALTREKASTLKSMLFTTKARVGTFGGNYYTPGGMTAVSVAVCTIEKANNFVNKMINENKLSELGIIVVDEIHYLGDESRGYQLELLLTKVLYYNESQDRHKRIQIVGLSATIPNLESIAVWLKASLYVTEYRPVPLVEKIKLGENIFEVPTLLRNPSCDPLTTIDKSKTLIQNDHENLFYLCIESIIEGHSTLVFCESKRDCEIMAVKLSSQIKIAGGQMNSQNKQYADVSNKLRTHISKAKILDIMEKLKKCPAGADKELVKSLAFGVAFHHAGLTSEEREIIEDGFKGGAIKTLLATSTLSSGVNLPARRVIINSPTMFCSTSSGYQREMLNPTTYRQMIGRAGRKNIDTSGESILICTDDNRHFAMKLIKSSLGHICSSLAYRMIGAEGEPSGLKKAILEVIANNTAKTRPKLNQYLQSTFWLSCSSPQEDEEFHKAVTKTLRYLISNKFIEELKPGLYKSTRLGNAVLASGLHPDESLELVQDLIKARQCFCLLNDLHIIYQVTPSDIYRSVELKDWHQYSQIWNELDDVSRSVGELVGIDEITLSRRCQGFTSAINDEKERIYRRFWVALVINDLINELPLPKICAKYKMTKATVQLAQRAVARFAGVISIFCEELGYENVAALVSPLESRINFSCQRDLLDLIQLNITRPIARALYSAGYKNVISVAKGDKLDVEFAIRQIKPFKRDASFSLESENVPSMWVPELAKTMTILDYASHIVDTARSYVEIVYEIDLTPSTSTSTKRREDDFSEEDESPEKPPPNEPRSPSKRSRLDNGSYLNIPVA